MFRASYAADRWGLWPCVKRRSAGSGHARRQGSPPLSFKTRVKISGLASTTLEQGLSILHVVAPAPFGGLESVLHGLATGHLTRGYAVQVATIVSPGPAPHPFTARLQADGVNVCEIGIAGRAYAVERGAVATLCDRFHPDIVHTHGFRPDVVDGSVARRRGIALVSTCHGFIERNWRGKAYQWLQRRCLRQFDAVIAVSRPIGETLRAAGVSPSRIHVIPNGHAPRKDLLPRRQSRRELGLPDRPVIGWVGRLSAEKGPDVALAAFARMAAPDVRLAMIGAGAEDAILRSQAASLGIDDRVIWFGSVPDAGRYFAAFDGFLLSSRTEGTPMALLEAMAANVPIVATRVGGVPDVIDAASACLAESGDVASLAAALDDLFERPTDAHARAERARARLEIRFDIEAWLSRYEAIYHSVRRSPSTGSGVHMGVPRPNTLPAGACVQPID